MLRQARRAAQRALGPVSGPLPAARLAPVLRNYSEQSWEVRPVEGDQDRKTCTRCGFVDYQNPKVVAGVVCGHTGEDGKRRVLLLKRAIEPRAGCWNIPGGFLEGGESTEAGAIREAAEEAGAKVESHGLLAVYDIPAASQIMMWFRASFAGGDPVFSAEHETDEAMLVTEDEVPWEQLAFPVTHFALKDYFADPDGKSVTQREIIRRLPGPGEPLHMPEDGEQGGGDR